MTGYAEHTDPPQDDMTVHVRVEDVRRACNMLLDEVVSRYGPVVTLSRVSFEEDHYWDLQLNAAFQLVDQPELHIVAGQTSDDVAELRNLLESDAGSIDIVLGHDIAHLAGLLRRIAFLDASGHPG